MSQLPRSRFGFQGPRTVTATSTRTTRIPGTNATRTESVTAVAEVTPCPAASVPQPEEPPRQIARSSGLQAPRSSRLAQPIQSPAASVPRPEEPPRQIARPSGLQAPRSSRLAQPIQPPAASVPQPEEPPRQIARPSGLQAPRSSRLAQPIQSPAASVPQPEEPPRQIARPSGLQAPISSRLAQPPSAIGRLSQGVPTPSPSQALYAAAQPARGLRPPSQGPPQISVSRPTGIPQTPAQGAIPRQLPVPSGIPARGIRPPSGLPQAVAATPQFRKQQLAVPSTSTPNRRTPSPGSLAPRIERTLPVIHPKISRPAHPYGIGANVPKALTQDPFLYQRRSPEDMRRASLGPMRKITPGSLERQVEQRLAAKSAEQPKKKVSSKGKRVTTAKPEVMQTPAGAERVIQKAVFERRVERGEKGEKLVKNLAFTDFDESTGTAEQVEVGMQQLDPQIPTRDAKEVIGVTSTVSVTASYTTVDRKVLRTVTEPLDRGITMEPAEVAQLVREEKEDVDNTLKMIPPELNLAPGKFEAKQRLQQLRLHSESMALLEESIIRPEVTADEPHAEPSPEAMANVMHTVENGISPRAAPDQVFNSLFSESTNEPYIAMSSVSPGPLQDVVIPTEDVPKVIHQEAVSENMDKLADKFARIPEPQQVPYVDIFTRVMDDMKKSPEKGKNKPKSFVPITDERSLWVNAKLERLVSVIGAEPVDVLGAFDIEELSKSGDLEKEMVNGIEFYVDTDALQYINRIQLRGTQMPSYFPGFMVAVPDFPGIVRIARSPDEVFATAWKSVQPKYFAEDSLSAMSF